MDDNIRHDEKTSPTSRNLFKSCIRGIEVLDKKDRIKVLQYIKEDLEVKIHEHADGCRVILDDIPPEDLRLLSMFIGSLVDSIPDLDL